MTEPARKRYCKDTSLNVNVTPKWHMLTKLIVTVIKDILVNKYLPETNKLGNLAAQDY